MKLIFKFVIALFVFNSNLYALELFGKFEQGSFILGKTDPNSKVKIDNKDVPKKKKIINKEVNKNLEILGQKLGLDPDY